MNIIEEIQNTYPNKKVKYISNIEIEKFLNENKAKINSTNFQKLKEFFLNENKLNRSIFQSWEKENILLLEAKKGIIENEIHFPKQKEYKDLLVLRRYSRKTIQNYVGAVTNAHIWLMQNLKISIDKADRDDIRDYFLYLTEKQKLSASSMRVKRFSIEYYFREILIRDLTLDFALKMRKPNSLPTIFTKVEIVKILNSCKNLKHKMILSLLYSSGLRLSEVIHLKVKDISLEEQTLKVRLGKGYKDRITVLSEKLSSDLQVFLQDRKPNDILFPSNQSKNGKDSYLSSRTVEKIFENCLLKSGIKKHGTPHDFRHSFATHLLESGTDIHFIQKLLGHKNLSTTSIYTKLANPKIAGVKSPL